MGTCGSQPIRVAPVVLDASKQHVSMDPNGTDSETTSDRKSSTSGSTQRGFSGGRVRPLSRISKKSGRIGGGMFQGMGRIGGRPISRTDDSLNLSGKEDRLRETFSRKRATLATSSGLNQSQNSALRQISLVDPNLCESSSSEEFSTAVLRPSADESEFSATKCPCCLSQFGKIVHVPYLLLCGHSYCSSCINIALKNDPSFLKCGICLISTSIQAQSESKDLIKNEPILDLIENKDFFSILNNSVFDRCAECDTETAIVYCSDCSASFCGECSKQQHTGSRVRSKHKPVPISLKPRPQPTCKKHPGQSCVLYCETERQPMCVLCKFYGHHKFHNYQLLNNSSNAYRASLAQKLAQVEKIEMSLSRTAQNLMDSKQEIKKRAMESQEKLERSFEEAKEELIAALEQREAMLLVLLDRQVQKREEITEDEQEEVAFARARAIAAIEEAKRLLDLNPVSALLARKHMDGIIDTVLKQTVSFPEKVDDDHEICTSHNIQSQLLPLGLRSKEELSRRMSKVLDQHGAILQLPETPVFSRIKIHKDCILVQWKISEENTEVASDRTLTYSLQCFADIPFKFKKDKLFNFNKRFQNVNQPSSGLTPDSGFQDEASERSSQASENKAVPSLPSLPLALRNNNNVSLIALQETNQTSSNTEIMKQENFSDGKIPGKTTPITTTTYALGTETPKRSIPGLPNLKDNSLSQSAKTSIALLNLPPLLQKKETIIDSPDAATSSNSDSISSQSEDNGPLSSRGRGLLNVASATDETDSLSSSVTTLTNTIGTTAGANVSDLGRYCKGYAFEEIYSGRETKFRYSGVIRGATYYFRLRCHNAVGYGPWSSTYKCSVLPPLSSMSTS